MSSQIASRITDGIRVEVRTAYVEDESSPKQAYYVFMYQVAITNESDAEVQLLHRHWDIVDGLGQKRQVEGPGVVGQQPVLASGDCHQYVSGCHFATAVGMMTGQYLMQRTSDGHQFWVDIPAFTLQIPYLDN